MSSWYYRVSQDLGQIPDCITYYENELIVAKKELSLKGDSLEVHGAELAGLVEYRFGQLQEIEAILEYLNIQYKQEKTKMSIY